MQVADLALGQRDDPDAGERQPLEQAGHILLIARQPVERLGHDDVEAPGHGILQQRLDTGPQHRAAGQLAVGIGLHQAPALPLDPLPAQPDLVLDRGVALVVAGVAGVNGAAKCHGRSFRLVRPCDRSARMAVTTAWTGSAACEQVAWL